MPEDDFDIYGEDDGFSSIKVEVSIPLRMRAYTHVLTPSAPEVP